MEDKDDCELGGTGLAGGSEGLAGELGVPDPNVPREPKLIDEDTGGGKIEVAEDPKVRLDKLEVMPPPIPPRESPWPGNPS